MSNRVVFFVTNLDSGGLENYLLRFLELYANKFDDIIVFCKGARGGVLENQYAAIKNVRVLKQKIGNYHLHHYIWLMRWFKEHENYVVCDFTGNFGGPVLWAAKLSKISQRIAFYRSSSNRFKEDRVRLFLNRKYNTMVYRCASGIYANSRYAFDFFFAGRSVDERFEVIYNGLDVKQFLLEKSDLRKELEIRQDSFVIGHTGRYNRAKNHQSILEVAYRVLEKKSNVVFIMCGKGVKKHLSNEVEAKGFGKHILLFENRADISQFLNTCDAYIFPSTTEGQPNSLIEAWVKGLPFVASDIAPIKQLVPEEFYEYLASPYDVKKMTNLLYSIIDGKFDDAKKKALQKWARNTFEAEQRFEEFYSKLVN